MCLWSDLFKFDAMNTQQNTTPVEADADVNVCANVLLLLLEVVMFEIKYVYEEHARSCS